MKRDPGLPAERTTLAWTRTTFAVLAISGVIALRGWQQHAGPVGLLAITVALIVWTINARRQHTLRQCPRTVPMGLRREAHVVGAATIALSCASVLALEL